MYYFLNDIIIKHGGCLLFTSFGTGAKEAGEVDIKKNIQMLNFYGSYALIINLVTHKLECSYHW